MSQFQSLEQTRTVKQEITEEQTTQAPVFTTSMRSVEIKEGQRAHFECRIIPVSDPTLKVNWLLNGQPIKQGSRFKEGLDFGFVSLDIMGCQAEDAGTYRCRVDFKKSPTRYWKVKLNVIGKKRNLQVLLYLKP